MSSLPDTMTVIEIAEFGPPEGLRPAERAMPRPGHGEVLIKVAAAGVNRPDVMQRQGNYPPPPGAPDTPGLEVAGEIAALGPGVAEWGLGDRVCALVAGGGYAHYCLAPAALCLPVPGSLSMAEAAALPETFFTVWTNVFQRGALRGGESILVHGGSSGIGTTAIQLARAFGARVFATAGNDGKCRACEELGAEVAINYRDGDFVAVIAEATGGEGVDLILDMVGGDYLPRNLQALAVEGRLVQIAVLHGPKVEGFNILPVMLKRLTVTGSTLRPRSVAQKAVIADELRDRVWPLLEQGAVRPVMDQTFPLDQAAAAHARMESSEHIGKIVLEV
ncbi:MAG: NAD(P)H-quinone oxidoreductase [Alphaproteobacteria bacterium]|jgi:putative PIG3 family NAD(P)H quinone oxidoreductase|nr:NAD(P)H-quinone oxidoreductase [Alphaproteobacteria bacterium]MDP6565280.1 NAD(P)H-quinone oxidoreductase [Alphaproteobacteria bacterium]